MVTVEYGLIPLTDLAKAADLFGLLSDDEKRRSQQFKFPELQQRFVIARGSLRQILGTYLNQHPTEIVFHYGEYGKPLVGGISFNFSHTKELAIYAIVVDQTEIQVGIDLEKGDRQNRSQSLAKRFFNPLEYQYLQQLPAAQQPDAFLQFWTAKEAYLKGQGTGLQGGLDQIIVTLEPQPAFVNAAWSLKLFKPNPDHWAAIAVHAPTCTTINCGEWH